MSESERQFARACLFCGREGVTKTHVFAKSFTGIFEGDGREALVRHDRTDPETGETETLKKAKTFAFKPKAACQDCNGGWMRELEEDLKPVLRGFAENRRMTLSPKEQGRLALWATVAAILQMLLDPEDLQFANPKIGEVVYKTRQPPPGTQIWVGANSHGEMGSIGAHSLQVDGNESDGTWGAAVSFGHGNLHIVHHGRTDSRWVLRGAAHHLLSQILPTSPGVRWPPRDIVARRDLSSLAELIVANAEYRAL